jgi:hypothetical protein
MSASGKNWVMSHLGLLAGMRRATYHEDVALSRNMPT